MITDGRSNPTVGGKRPSAEPGERDGRLGTAGPVRLVMLVDDDLSILQVLARMLKDQGCRVITCRDGLEALDALDFIRPDLIISDLDMPFVDGVEFFRRCRAVSGPPVIPFVIVSGRADAEQRLREIRGGLAGFYQKPISMDTLTRIVRPREDPGAA